MISVVMSTFNEPEDYVKQTIESILEQTYSNFEFIIVIDNPKNAKIQAIIKDYSKKDSRICIIKNENNIGLTASLNKALCQAKGEYIARIDADDVAEKNRFEEQLRYLIANNLDLIGCEMRRISESGETVSSRTNVSYPHECIEKLLMYDNCVPHPSWFVKREVYEELNGYEEIRACEDYYFLLRALNHGFKIGIADSILMNYRINTKGISRNNSLRQMLSGDYLQKNYNRIDDVYNLEVQEYISKKCIETKAERYEIAQKKLNHILENIKKKKYIYAAGLFWLPLMSQYILLNYKKILKLRMIRYKYRNS